MLRLVPPSSWPYWESAVYVEVKTLASGAVTALEGCVSECCPVPVEAGQWPACFRLHAGHAVVMCQRIVA